MHARTLKSLFRGILASTVVGAPLVWVACSGSSSGNAVAPSDAGLDAPDAIEVPCEAGLVVLQTLRPMCVFEIEPPCGFDASSLSDAECAALCPDIGAGVRCMVTPIDAGVDLTSCGACANGRRPLAPLRRRRLHSGGAVESWFSEVAALEAASVTAFHELRGVLRHFGAPRSLLDACGRAAVDERRHARSMARLGGVSTPALVRRNRKALAPSLEALATHNAREGCIRETYGALVATVQSTRAADVRTRRAMRSIARDEIRHAALAWRVHAWAMSRLTATARARVLEGARDAEQTLIRELAVAPAAEVRVTLGVPSADEAVVLAHGLRASLRL